MKNNRIAHLTEKAWVIFETFRFNIHYHFHGMSDNLLNCHSYAAVIGNHYLLSHKLIKKSTYTKLVSQVFKHNEDRLREKNRIKVCIVIQNRLSWPGDKLYELLKNDDRYEVVICYPVEKEEPLYIDTLNYFHSKGIPLYLNEEKEKWTDSDLFWGAVPALLIPHNEASITRRKLSSLSVVIPYSFWHDLDHNNAFFNHFTDTVWRVYLPTEIHRKMGVEKSFTDGHNMIFSGYPKLDAMLCGKATGEDWSFAHRCQKKVLYTPGFPDSSSTFVTNNRFILDSAKKRTDIAWIYRAHPYMREMLERNGIMKKEVYDKYIDEWEKLPNAKVSYGGDYYDMFLTSDAMITDSISFVSGYQYTKKPLLVLKCRKGMRLNEYGTLLMSVQECVFGDDYSAIEQFLEDVVAESKKMSDERRYFYEHYLDYYTIFGKSVSERIYNNIQESLSYNG